MLTLKKSSSVRSPVKLGSPLTLAAPRKQTSQCSHYKQDSNSREPDVLTKENVEPLEYSWKLVKGILSLIFACITVFTIVEHKLEWDREAELTSILFDKISAKLLEYE